jgi:peptide-methionine (R)-S-oxide reductase
MAQGGMSRRGFLSASIIVLAPVVPVLRALGGNRQVVAFESAVDIVEFTDDGVRKGIVRVAKVVKTDEAWRRQLSPIAYLVARERGTEVPFSGAYWDLHDKGLFRCVCCETALFASSAKFDSRTGWPSFWQPMAKENVRHGEPSSGYSESEVTCRRCDAHLGDLFDNGPQPTGLRYCIDSVSLRFIKAKS